MKKNIFKKIFNFLNIFFFNILTNVWNFGVLNFFFTGIQLVLKIVYKIKNKINVLPNKLILSLTKDFNNYYKFISIILNIFVIIIVILFFYINIPNMYCLDKELKEWDYLCFIQENNLKYISHTHPSINMYDLDELNNIYRPVNIEEKEWDYLCFIRENNLKYISHTHPSINMYDLDELNNIYRPVNIEEKEWDYFYFTQEDDLKYISHTHPSVNKYRLNNIHSDGGPKHSDYWIKKSIFNLDSLYIRRETKNVFDKEMNFFIKVPDYISPDVINIEQFVKKQVDTFTENRSHENMLLTIDYIKKMFSTKKGKLKTGTSLFNISQFNKTIIEDIIWYEVSYNYLSKEYENKSHIIDLIIQNKIKSRRGVIDSARILYYLDNVKTIDEFYYVDLFKEIYSSEEIYSKSNNFYINNFYTNSFFESNFHYNKFYTSKNNLYFNKFYSKILNESLLVYSPSTTFYFKKFPWHFWFELSMDQDKKVFLTMYSNTSNNEVVKHFLYKSDYPFDFLDYEKLKSNFWIDDNKNYFCSKYRIEDKYIETLIFFPNKKDIYIKIIDNKRVNHFIINVKTGEEYDDIDIFV